MFSRSFPIFRIGDPARSFPFTGGCSMSRHALKVICFVSVFAAGSAGAMAGDLFPLHFLQRSKPHASSDPAIEEVAKEIDYLEAIIEDYGTIVPKHPDVWGEARLTKHRQEMEEELAKELPSFRETLNGSLRRSDQSFLSAAFTITAASGGASAPDLTNIQQMVEIPSDAINRTEANQLSSGVFGTSLTEGKIESVSLEPTVVLEQKFRYLNLLNELRRINEGDDTADSPGYSLNLVRIPVSLLPGKKTDRGYGAEITFTATPHLTDKLLPNTFRNLVINDVVDVLALPGRRVLDDPKVLAALRSYLAYESSKIQPASPADSLPSPRTSKAERSQGDQNNAEYLELKNRVEAVLDERSGFTAQPMDPREAVFEFEEILKELITESLTGSLVFGRSSQSRAALSPLEVFDVYGQIPLTVVALDGADVFSRDPVNQNVPHLADIESFLAWELNTAYDFLSRPDTLHLWHSHCTPELVEAIRQRRRFLPAKEYKARKAEQPKTADTVNVAFDADIDYYRAAFFNDIRRQYPRAAFSTTASLAWCIIVNAALLNDRLMQDMAAVAADKEAFACYQPGIWAGFYYPTPAPEDIATFNQYVQARWPVHVFAIDPVADEQNIAEVFSQRRELQLAMAAGVASGNISPSAALNFARRLELDLETIDLHRKTVAFVHGENVFGWRFYPRFQSPPVPGTLGAFVQTTFGIGQSDRALLKNQRLEPGMREVAAVVLMPSFVNYVTFDSRANWFSLTNPKHKELTMHDAMRISRTWQNILTCMPQPNCPQKYRAEDISWLTKSVQQIENRLPLQSTLVQVPYENTLGGFEMFNSGITDLAPALSGWYGAPGISVTDSAVACACENPVCPEQGGIPYAGVENYGGPNAAGTCIGTTIFLVGTNFSVHDTRVIAGGRSIPFRLLSRRIMQVTIPPNVTRLTESLSDQRSRQIVDVHVATPYGVSNHLQVPADIPPTQPPVATAVKKPGFYWKKTAFKAVADRVGGEVPQYRVQFYHGNAGDLKIENLKQEPAPTTGFALVLAYVEGSSEPIGQTVEFPIKYDVDSKQIEVSAIQRPDGIYTLLDDVQQILEGYVRVDRQPSKVTLVGFLKLDNWPYVQLEEPITVDLAFPALNAAE